MTNNLDLSGQLIGEFYEWFTNNLEKGELLPKVFSGITADKRQFILMMGDLGIEKGLHLEFMKYVVNQEQVIAFVATMRINVQLSEEPLQLQERYFFFSGQEGSFYSIEVTPKIDWQFGYDITTNKHTERSHIFFQDLFSENCDENIKAKYSDLWANVRDKILWRER